MKKPLWISSSRLLSLVCVTTAGLAHAQLSPPEVSSFSASAVGATSATLNGTAFPFNAPTSGWFQWGTTTNYGNVTTHQPLGNCYCNTNFSQGLAGLLGGLTYHFRAVATNADGIGFGTNQSFTTRTGLTNTSTSFVFSALTTFGGGDGWLAPGEGGYAFLGTTNGDRGLAYGNDHLYLVSRAGGNFIRILNPLTGSDLGALDTTGISGGALLVNMVVVGGDGVIYVGNLAGTASTSFPFKVYKWVNEGSTPTVAYSGDAGLFGSRVGDTLAVIGGGSSTRLAAGFHPNQPVTGANGYTVIDPTAGTATAIAFGTPPNFGDFHGGLTFSDSSHVLGTPGTNGAYRYTSFAGATGTLIGSPAFPDPVGANRDCLLACAMVGGIPLLAVQNTVDSHVSIYDVTDPASPKYLASANNTVTPVVNSFATGELAWGDIGVHAAHLWAMSSNQGIQAFLVVVPSPVLAPTRLNDKIVLSWSTNFSGYGLESSTNAGPPTFWTSVSPPAVVSGTNFVVTNSITGNRQFYRLKK